jgi:hypothetical protein
MAIDTDAARSDLVLAAAAALIGPSLVAAVRAAPPAGGTAALAAAAADIGWTIALTALVPVLLARARGDGRAAFGLTGPALPALARGVPLALAPAALGVLALVTIGAAPRTAMFGRLGAVGDAGLGTVAAASAVRVAGVAALSTGALLLPTFLAVRSHDAFVRSPDWTTVRALRTVGMAAATTALIAGLLRALTGGSVVLALANAATLAVVVLVADRLIVTARTSVPRAAVMAPAIIAFVAHTGLIGVLRAGDLVGGIQAGALAAGTSAVMAAVALSPMGTWALVPLAVTLHVWPTCLSPLRLASGVC